MTSPNAPPRPQIHEGSAMGPAQLAAADGQAVDDGWHKKQVCLAEPGSKT